MSAHLIDNSPTRTLFTPRDLAATLFRRPRLVSSSFIVLLLGSILIVFFSARYESHFKVLLRRGRLDPMASSLPSSVMDFTHPEITEEELNSEVELLRDHDLLTRAVEIAALIPAATPDVERAAEVEHTVRKVERRLEIEALKKSNMVEVSYKDNSPERAARVLTALSEAYMQKHTSLQRPGGEIQFFDKLTTEYENRLHQSETALMRFTQVRGVVSAALQRDIALQKLGEADANYRQIDLDRAEAERRLTSLAEQLRSFPSRSVTLNRWADNAEALEKMKTHLLELQFKRTELLTRFEPSYRLVREVELEINQAGAAIASESLAPVRDETTDKNPNYEWARMEMERDQVLRDGLKARQSHAGAQVVSLRTFAQQMQADSIAQQDLFRDAKVDEDNYLLYLRKREDARVGDALDQHRILNVAIVEPPRIPALPTHSMFLYSLIAVAFATAFSIGIAFTSDYFDPTIRTPEEAYNLLEVPVLTWLPPPPASVSKRDSGLHIGRSRVVVQ
jgi:uncharacterized protein involved in exopolysaccharide biosynthesis